jgi:RimJ/RimL family protein N-acetyltransferase
MSKASRHHMFGSRAVARSSLLACSLVAMLEFPDPPLCDSEVVLQPWTEGDVDAVVKLAADPAIVRWSHLPSPFDHAGVWRWFYAMAPDRAAGTALKMKIAGAGKDRLLGAIALMRIDWDSRSGELGYWLAASARGRGVATRAIGLLTRWALAELRLGRIDAIPDLDNGASRRVLERCGFMFERELLDRTPPAGLYSLHASRVPRASDLRGWRNS